MDVRYINPFLVSCRSVCDKMIHLPVVLGKPYLKQHQTHDSHVSAVIGLSGAVTGSVVMAFSQKVALALAGGLLGSPLSAIDADCIDALGEIANMIAGSAKKDLPGGLTTLSLPSVVLGSHQIAYPTGVPILVIPCETLAGSFNVEVAIRPTKADIPASPTLAAVPAQ